MSLRVHALTKTYGSQTAVSNVSFEARPGQIVGFLGPNGAGKSTTMKVATGYLPPTRGAVEVCGNDVVTEPMAVRRCLGYLPEHNPLYLDMYVHEYLRFIGRMYGLRSTALREQVQRVVALCGLTREQNKQIGSLSKGYRQRVGLAQALVHDPAVLILDEPTTGLDPNQLTEIRNLIKSISAEKTVVFSTHIMQEVQALCDRVVIINRGEVVVDKALADLQRGTSPGTLAATTVEVTFTQPVDLDLLSLVSGVQEVRAMGEGVYQISSEQTEDVRPAVFRFACQHNHVMIGIKQLDTSENQSLGSLEEIFRNLTATNNERLPET
ncbi:MAG: gliding motility-associated ABC transporter ATP-binding subunit GldA [Tunicatimonas sp.]